MNNALYLNGSKTAYPFAVATHYSFDAGQLHLFKTREAALAFIQQPREDEIANDRDMGYEYRNQDLHLCCGRGWLLVPHRRNSRLRGPRYYYLVAD